MRPLHEALAGWHPTGQPADPLDAVRADWPQIAGPEIAANSRPESIVRGQLLILTRSGAWSQQLAFLSERMLGEVQRRTGLTLSGIRFRVGRLAERRASAGRPPQRSTPRGAPRSAGASLEAVFDQFRTGVLAAQRAKAQAGWKECSRCGVRVLPTAGPLCVPCANAHADERSATIARLLFDVPWIGYDGAAALIEHLTPQEYGSVRRQLLSRWWDALARVRRTGGRTLTTRDRMIASSYVLLKSELDPEQIAPAVVRDLLGDELHEIFYGDQRR